MGFIVVSVLFPVGPYSGPGSSSGSEIRQIQLLAQQLAVGRRSHDEVAFELSQPRTGSVL